MSRRDRSQETEPVATALVSSGLTYRYPGAERPALDGISLEIRSGSFYGILGTNGSGKTTFLNLICGLLRPTAGELSVVGERPGTHAAQRKLGLCPQEVALYPTLSARENLMLFGRLSGVGRRELRERVDRCLEIARLQSESDVRVARYSGGMKRRLNIATALIHEPHILLLDEPTVGVDPQSRAAIHGSLESICSEGTTILYTSHYLEEVEKLCDRVVVIDRGERILEGATREVVARGQNSPTFRLRLAPSVDAERVASELSDQELCASVTEEGEVEFAAGDLASAAAEISRLARRGDIVACESHRPTLEERFLGLTGRALRNR